MTLSNALTKEMAARVNILVIGDVMLNHYLHGQVARISPEGPFPILNIETETRDAGGAAGVAENISALGARATLIGVIGDDAQGAQLKNICSSQQDFVTVSDRPTTVKTRLIGNGIQMMRADTEKTDKLSGADEAAVIAKIEKGMENAQAVILSDYAKGVLTQAVVRATIDAAKKRNIPVLVDPKGKDFSLYAGADIVTPNRKELRDATNMPVDTDAAIIAAAKACIEKCDIGAVLATRSEQGMTLVTRHADAVHMRAQAREVFDVSGAGDTVIATFAVSIAAGLSFEEAADYANRAGGIVVAKKGVCVIRADELFDIKETNISYGWDETAAKIKSWQAEGLRVGFTNGCFDILHAGHVTYLAEARKHCDRLVLALNSDASVRLLKGPTRPVNDEQSRAIVMAALASVDAVVLFGAEKAGDDNTPCALLDRVRPDIYFKGGDYTEDQLKEAKIVRAYGGDVKLMGLVEGKSTTNIISKINAA